MTTHQSGERAPVPATSQQREQHEALLARHRRVRPLRAAHPRGGAALHAGLSPHERPRGPGHLDVTVMWQDSVVDVVRVRGTGAVTIGPAATNSFLLCDASLPSPTYRLVTAARGGITVHAREGMQASVDGRAVHGSFALAVGEQASVRVGPVTFQIQYSAGYRRAVGPTGGERDAQFAKLLAMGLILQVGLLSAFFVTPHRARLGDDDLLRNPAKLEKLRLAQLRPPRAVHAEHRERARPARPARAAARPVVVPQRVAARAGAPAVNKAKRDSDRQLAMDALAALGLGQQRGAASGVFGAEGLDSTITQQLSGLRGASMGDTGGMGDLGARRTGAGGGGTGFTIGGLSSGPKGADDPGNIDLGARGKPTGRIVVDRTTAIGGLSREEIQRVVSRAMSQIKFCYERELTKDQDLQGKLAMRWTISSTGDVTDAEVAQNTFNGAAATPVAQCVTRIVQRLRFPNPKGGGQVVVTYPLVFSAAGG